MNSEAFTKLTKAKSRLVQQHPFFATIILSLPLIEADWLPSRTMATDMRNIYYHPDFVNDCSVNETMAVLCHEAMHVAYLHGLREGDRDHKIWNIACDYAINPVILDAGMTLPQIKTKDGTYVPPFYNDEYRNMSAQAIYDELIKNAVKISISFDGEGGEGSGDGDTPMYGSVMKPQQQDGDKPNGKELSESDRNELESEIKIKVKAAAETAKSRGTLPGGLEGLIEAIGKPKIDWKAYIQQWVTGITPDDYSWTKPNKHLMANYDIYMPHMQMNGSGVGLLSIDTSGSVSDAELVAFVNEIVGIIEICKPEKLYIIQHDAVIQKVEVWEGDPFTGLKTKGRGGTCIMPTFRHVNKLEEHIDWMIVCSDMEIGDWPQNKKDWPSYPVLLLGTGPDTSPAGLGTYIPLRDAI